MLNELDYAEFLSGVGIEKGDIIDVSSDMANVLMYCRSKKVRLTPDGLIDALKELVGKEGTVMIRTFTWDYCHGKPFDIRTSPSRVGALGNAAMKRTDFARTKHPIYSWMVWGKYADYLVGLENRSAFGDDTPFDFLDKKKAKQLTLGNTHGDSTTQMHHVEAVCKVPYRFDKPFTANYTDINGNTEERTYSMHVRPLNMKVANTEVDRGEHGKKLRELGIMQLKQLDEVTLISSIKLDELTTFLVDDMNNNDGKFTVAVNGVQGYNLPNVDWNSLQYF